jgi:hypothetical protein
MSNAWAWHKRPYNFARQRLISAFTRKIHVPTYALETPDTTAAVRIHVRLWLTDARSSGDSDGNIFRVL